MAKKNVRRMGRKVLSLLMALTMVTSIMQVSAFAAPFGFDANENSERGNWSYAYYLGQEYLGNASGDPVKPDPVGYGFQGVITDITFTDDVGTEWTFVWSSVANGEWRITGSNVSESKAKAWPQITVDKVYVGTCGDEEYRFTLSADGSAADWTYARNNYANWFYYIRFVRDYTVNVYYQNETGDVIYNEVVYAAAAPETGEFTFYYPDGGIIDDSELEDGEYTDPVTLLPENFLSDEMKAQGYEITAATDANGNDVLTDGVTISLIHENVLNVYCTLKAPETDTYKVVHEYYTNEIIDNTVEDELEIQAGTVINAELIEELKNPVNEELTYEFTSYDVDPATKTITLIYNRVYEPTADPVDSVIRYGVEKIWVDENAPTGHVRPESVTVELYADGKATGESVVLSEENNWAYTWSDLPAGKDYVAVETVPENYQVTSRQVAEGKYTVKGSLERITSCSETEIEVPAADVPSFIVVSLTNKNDVRKVFGKYDYVVWSDYELSDASKSELVELVAADSAGNFNKIELKNTLFLYDGGANPYAEYVSFERSGESVVGTSLKTSAVWSQILYGAADAAPAYTELTNTVVVPPATGSLEITKVVEGEANVPTDAAFTVIGPNGYSQTIAYSEFKGGKYMLEGLELGAYTVSENETSAQVSGYELTIRENNAEIEVKENETAAVTITNTYEAIRIPTGSLTVQKNIVGLADGAVMPDNTKFQLLKGDELVAEVTWADFNQETNSYTFVNLPLGNYSINEVGGAVSGYSGPSLLKVYDGNGGNGFAAVTDGGNASAVITNTYEKIYVPQPALSVTKVADVETAKVGDVITYTITMTNTGDANSTNVVIVDTPDRNVTIGEISNDGVYENGKITWNVATLPAGISWSATVKATVKNTDAEQVVNIVAVSDDANNSDDDTAVVTLKGSLTIVKQIRGLDARSESKLKEVLSFTVTDPNGESSEYSYSDFRSGKLEIEDPIPGVYTVTESNAEVDGYILDNGDGSWEVEIREGGRAKTLNIVNKYTGKTYNIWFDGGNHGDVRNDLGNPVTGVWRNLWTEIHAEESYFEWSGFSMKEGWKVYQMGVSDTNNLYDDLAENHEIAEGTSVVLYHFTWAQWLDYKQEMSEGKPGLEIEQGWKSDREFYLDGGETAFASFEAAVEYMNANPDSTVDANGFYNAYYVAKYENDPVPPYVPPTYDPDPVVPPVVIVEPEVPLVELPEEEVPLADEPLVEIPEEEVPLADVPKTGDALVLQMILTSGTGLGLIALALSGKKREEEDV